MQPDLDDTVPGLTPAQAVIARGLDDADTVVRQRAVALSAQGSVEQPVDLGDTAPIEPLEPSRAPTASFGFRIGRSSAVTAIESAVFIGRRPSTPRIRNGVLPRLVTVPSPEQLVSATHLGLAAHASTLVVTDMRSTNGSVVMVPGRDPRTLLQGESLVVSPGTLVDIGDGNVIEIVSLGRLSIEEGSV